MITKIYKTTIGNAFDLCITTLEKLEYNVTQEDFNNGQISAKKSGSLLSYGHNLTINLFKKENNKIEIEIESISKGIQIIDWGTNNENEEELIDLISKIL